MTESPLTLQESLDKLEAEAFNFGRVCERARVTAILNSPNAAGRLQLAWEIAQTGASPKEADEALKVYKIVNASTPIDPGAALSH